LGVDASAGLSLAYPQPDDLGDRSLTPRQRANTRDLSIETRPFRAGRGHTVSLRSSREYMEIR